MIFHLLSFNAFDPIVWVPFVFVFAMGAVIGSFLNVVIHRLPREESIVYPNSACPSCQTAIKPYDNVPILGWLILGGRCRNCRSKISPRYPAVELLTAILFTGAFLHDGLNPVLPFSFAFIAALIALIFIDAEHMILPDAINFPFLAIAIIARILLPAVTGLPVFDDLNHSPLANLNQPLWLVSIFGAVLGALTGGGSLWLIGWIWKKLRGVDAMGLGDVKMMLWVGAFLGWRLTLLTLFLGAFTGALAGMAFILLRKERDLQTQIPFGIFLGLGALAAFFFGEHLINWYLNAFVPS